MTETLTLGGSRVASAIAGWSSPIRMFGEITGKPGFSAPADTGAMRLGRKLQPVIFSELRDMGYDAHEYIPFDGERYAVEHVTEDRPWLVGHPDGQADDYRLVVEAKAQHFPHADLSAQVQALVYMHLGGYSGGLLATLAGLHVEARELERDDEAIGRILALADSFWQHVQDDVWPAATGHPDDRAAIGDAYASPVAGRKARETRTVREARRELKQLNEQDGKHGPRARRKHLLGAVITAHLGDADTLIDANGETVARWTAYEARRMDTAALRADRPELAAEYETVTSTRRLTLT